MENVKQKINYTNKKVDQELVRDKKRIKYIDIARGIAIILMVIGHVIEAGLGRNIIYSFHMVLFIIVSGY